MFLVPGLQLVIEFLYLHICQCGQRRVSDVRLYPCFDFGAISAERGGLEVAAISGQPFVKPLGDGISLGFDITPLIHGFQCGGQLLAAFRIGGLADRPEEKDAKYILKRLEVDGRMELSKRELLRLCRKFHSVDDMEPGLAELSKRGYVHIGKIQTGGRPTESVILNPVAKGQKGQKGQKGAGHN